MASRRIVWTLSAKLQLKDIFEYFNFRNKSKVYSLKLNALIHTELKILLQQPTIGKKTDSINVRGLLIENHYIFYEIAIKKSLLKTNTNK